MIPGPQVDPAMPEGSTVSQENVQDQSPGLGAVMSPINIGLKGGGMNLAGLASRAVAAIEKMDPNTKIQELNKMKGLNPQLYSLVQQELLKRGGSQADPLDPVQSPMPQQKPSRRTAPLG